MRRDENDKLIAIERKELLDLIAQHNGDVAAMAKAIGYTRQGIYFAIHRENLAAACVKARQQAGVEPTYRMWGGWEYWQRKIMEDAHED